MQNVFELKNSIRDYHWGSKQDITELLGQPARLSPQAELWLGAHPGCPSVLVDSGRPLHEAIAADPVNMLGEQVNERYGRLPFLFKVLSAAQPLSIQVHPTLEQARERFAKEDAAGVPRDAAERNYKDDNHKPEMLYALTDFVALSGFRVPEEIIADLRLFLPRLSTTETALTENLIAALQSPDPLARALNLVLTSGTGISDLVLTLCGTITADPVLQENVQFAELVRINEIYPADAGVLVALLLNLVFLKPGEAISLGAGNVHAYLRGLGIEVMANSDNVLRGGLTSKHIDVPELLEVTIAEPSAAPLLQGTAVSEHSQLFQPAFDEFQLQVVDTAAPQIRTELQLHGAALVLCTAGEFSLETSSQTLQVSRGGSVFIAAHELPVTAVSASPGAATLFAASAQGK
ncbi:mannose-6-phosphate isomerase, class I [Arthrobacter sp. MYb211]|nr:mannose-6-phosphate isomerase, class I [Arthrobacter sp. MYb229]PRA09970.1 mannose-6-phosphate isomerase, class I [Arthrobacter sp. MYb221]PRB47203.1 mannose-6-phosphate isomerase, class I [Arthrobacter sp. MYb216]PRC05051.1 mannose-6-phosphate isomerase, class I [Arthrobacter sp. MYb211]